MGNPREVILWPGRLWMFISTCVRVADFGNFGKCICSRVAMDGFSEMSLSFDNVLHVNKWIIMRKSHLVPMAIKKHLISNDPLCWYDLSGWFWDKKERLGNIMTFYSTQFFRVDNYLVLALYTSTHTHTSTRTHRHTTLTHTVPHQGCTEPLWSGVTTPFTKYH